MRLLGPILAAVLVLLHPAPLPAATQVRLPVETATSSLEVELCVLAECDAQISPLQGFLVVGLDLDATPPQISLRNFDLQAVNDYNFHLDYGFLGDILAHGRSLRVHHATPGPAQPAVPVADQRYTFSNVPYLLSGTADYNASGTICALIQGNGQPCTGNIDLATQPAGSITEVAGTIATNNNILRLAIQFSFLSPIDANNPDLGTISGRALVNASVPFRPGLVPAGSDWKYHDLGIDLGTSWRTPTFNDDAWSFGPARLGYGGDGEATLVRFGADPANKQITTYFRHGFVVADPSLVQTMNIEVLRDDGAIVYLNGTEVLRDNMPAGPVTFSTLALTNVSGAGEFSFSGAGVSPSLLVAGMNVIAAEVHQGSTNSSDLGFDFVLTAVFGNSPPTATLVSPQADAVYRTGADIVLEADASDGNGTVSLVEFFSGANKLGQTVAAPYRFVWNNAPAGFHTLMARATDNRGATGASAAIDIRVGLVSLIPTGSVWRFLDDGAELGTAWRAPGFDHSGWRAGPAELGYGDADEATPVGFGANPDNKFVTTYFRRTWPVLDTSLITNLTVRLRRDDGGIVYLNGAEVFRSNMPTGAVNHLTLAPTVVGAGDEVAFFSTHIDPALLRAGPNTVAVEVHQSATNSSDVSFELELVGATRPAAPALRIVPGSGGYVLSWPSTGVGYRLWATENLRTPTPWTPLAVSVRDDGTWRSVTVPDQGNGAFFRLAE